VKLYQKLLKMSLNPIKMTNKHLSYRTFDSLMASVESDLTNMSDEGIIDRGKCIKIAQYVNEDLGLKINSIRETVVDIENYRAEIPLDIYKINYALICGSPIYVREPGEIFGTHTEFHEVLPCDSCLIQNNACVNECGSKYWISRRWKDNIVRYTTMYPIRISERSRKICTSGCPNLGDRNLSYEVDFSEGSLTTNIKECSIYINYIDSMIDSSGNLIILDHPKVRPYYEYAIKKHIIENAYVNKEGDYIQTLQWYKNELREARDQAISFVSVIEPSEIHKAIEYNRWVNYYKFVKPITG